MTLRHDGENKEPLLGNRDSPMIIRSWIDSANAPGCDFPLANLPYGAFCVAGQAPRCGVAIGDFVLDLARLEKEGLIDAGAGRPIFSEPVLNAFMALGPAVWQRVREHLIDLLAEHGNPSLSSNRELCRASLFALPDILLTRPIHIGGYTDFNAARQHAFNAGSMLRGAENALPMNWTHMPIGYNGRASTVVVSGTPIRRPWGQFRQAGATEPVFAPSLRLDFELEMGAIVGFPTEMGQTLTVDEAEERIFGYVLLNDWSARDIQAWETHPLGPFQGKAFGTSISPWIVTRAALEPFRTAGPVRERSLLPYLTESRPMLYDIALEAEIRPRTQSRGTIITRSNFRHLYYSPAQLLAHHACGGCRMETGDLLGTGTISGVERQSWASLLELSSGGKEAITLDTGETRHFLEDGDTLTLRAWARREELRIGFGECAGTVLPAHSR